MIIRERVGKPICFPQSRPHEIRNLLLRADDAAVDNGRIYVRIDHANKMAQKFTVELSWRIVVNPESSRRECPSVHLSNLLARQTLVNRGLIPYIHLLILYPAEIVVASVWCLCSK